jgi:hypothetical protein
MFSLFSSTSCDNFSTLERFVLRVLVCNKIISQSNIKKYIFYILLTSESTSWRGRFLESCDVFSSCPWESTFVVVVNDADDCDDVDGDDFVTVVVWCRPRRVDTHFARVSGCVGRFRSISSTLESSSTRSRR